MSQHVSATIQDKTAVILLHGWFNFAVAHAFRTEFEGVLANHSVRDIQIHLGGVEYMDSAALGVLRVSKDSAESCGKTITLTNVRGPVKQVLEIADFHRLFTII